MNEGELKSAVEDYLQYGVNQEKWVFLRLNAGDFIEVRGKTRRRIKGCPAGTADFVVIKKKPLESGVIFCPYYCRVIFLELKSEKGRWAPEQRAFKILVEAQGAEYHIIRSIDELQALL